MLEQIEKLKGEALLILDFFNSVKDIKGAFNRFYTAASLSRATDVNVLYELKAFRDKQNAKYKNNQDTYTRILAFQKIFEDVMLKSGEMNRRFTDFRQ